MFLGKRKRPSSSFWWPLSSRSRGPLKIRGVGRSSRRGRRYRGQRWWKNSGYIRNQVSTNRKDFVVPSPYNTRLVYSDAHNLTNVGGLDTYIYRGNSLNDPDHTGAGAQPLGYDELMAIYSNNTVFSCSIEVQVDNLTDDPILVAVAPKGDATPFTEAHSASSFPGAVQTLVAAGSNEVRTLNNFCTTKKIFGKVNVVDDNDLQANAALNPSQSWYWHIVVQNLNGDANDVWVRVRMIFFAQFRDIANLNLS